MRSIGRADVRVTIETVHDGEVESTFFLVNELKSRDFDRLSSSGVRQAIQRDRRQVLRYVSAVVELDRWHDTIDCDAVFPSVTYALTPSDPALKERIENFLDEDAIAVVWADDPIGYLRETGPAVPAASDVLEADT